MLMVPRYFSRGDAISENDALVGRAIADKETVQAYEIVGGNAFDPKARLTSRILTVGQLLTPLAREDVPIVGEDKIFLSWYS